MRIIKLGSKGEEVSWWQEFLRGENLYHKSIDGDFGTGTDTATKAYESKHNIFPDGVVDDKLWGLALLGGLSIAGSKATMPDKPDFEPLSLSQRELLFGKIEYVANPVPGNAENIRITNNWQSGFLTKVVIPQLKGIRGASFDGTIFWNKFGTDQIKGLFAELESEGLLGDILSWDGSWAPRFIRNRPGSLSNHAHAVAFDINASFNGLGRNPSVDKGCVFRIVPIAHKYGFYWGGHFSRPDGMHFELTRL